MIHSVDVSVLVCTFNRAAYLKDCLRLIVDQDIRGRFTFEVVVVDNGSTDGTRGVVETVGADSDVPVRYFFEPEPGVHQARNRSIAEAAGRWLAFIDDDELAEPRWLGRLFEAAYDTGARVVGGAVRLDLPDEMLGNIGAETRRSLRERLGDPDGPFATPFGKGTFPGTDNLMLDREIFESIGGFDESMHMGGADCDLMIRARRAGFEPWFVRNAVVLHRIPSDRLTAAYLKIDALRSGVMMAFLRRRYSGVPIMLAEMVARIGQGLLVTLPLRIRAWAVRDGAEALDRRIKLWRLSGFVRHAMATAVPWLANNSEMVDQLDFRKGRVDVSDEDQRRSTVLPHEHDGGVGA